MEQLIKDQEAVDQVKQIVEKEEAIMKQETDIVKNYAKVCQETSERNPITPRLFGYFNF